MAATPLLLGLLLAGCTPSEPPLPDANQTAAAVVSALLTGDISALPFVGSPDQAAKEYGIVTAGLSGAKPSSVEISDIAYQEDSKTATVRLTQTYDLGVGHWQFPSMVFLTFGGFHSPSPSDSDANQGDGWLVIWSPSIVQPALDGYTRLALSKTSATRGEILGANGDPIVWNRPIYRVGIDKSQVDADQALVSARALATLVGVDADAFVKQVANGGPRQFVVAITLRDGAVPNLSKIPGALAQPGTLSLGPTKTFALSILGVAGEATAEDIAKSDGAITIGDTVGHTGLQASQDSVLRGINGYTVYLAPRAEADVMAEPPDPSASDASPPTSPITSPQALFSVDPVDGGDIQTTLDIALQTKAEKALEKASGIASMVVLDVKTGAILAAANSSAAGANPYATTGRYAPGSTFKVSTALALLRTGMTENSKINCPVNVTVSGMTFKNVTGYAKSHNGSITLRQAVAWSCNTAVVNGSLKLGPDDLADAAASLGIGVDHNLGFPAFLGSVPSQTTDVAKAAASFGQSDVAASPLAMAAEAASVAAGHTVTPYLLVDPDTGQAWAAPDASSAPTTVRPLTDAEAKALRDMMAAVVSIGSGTALKGLANGAKTGTAEFNQDGKTLTHAWMIAFNGKYAVAAFVNVGTTGAQSAGPLLKAFLS